MYLRIQVKVFPFDVLSHWWATSDRTQNECNERATLQRVSCTNVSQNKHFTLLGRLWTCKEGLTQMAFMLLEAKRQYIRGQLLPSITVKATSLYKVSLQKENLKFCYNNKHNHSQLQPCLWGAVGQKNIYEKVVEIVLLAKLIYWLPADKSGIGPFMEF